MCVYVFLKHRKETPIRSVISSEMKNKKYEKHEGSKSRILEKRTFYFLDGLLRFLALSLGFVTFLGH